MCLTISETKAFNMVCALDMIQIHICFEYIVCMLNPIVLWWFQKFQYGICRGTHRWKDGVLTCVSPSMSTFKPCFSHVRKLLPPLNAQLQSLLPKPTILQPLICFKQMLSHEGFQTLQKNRQRTYVHVCSQEPSKDYIAKIRVKQCMHVCTCT